MICITCVFFFQAEDGIRDLVRSRGLGDVYKRQTLTNVEVGGKAEYRDRVYKIDTSLSKIAELEERLKAILRDDSDKSLLSTCLLYTSDAADERSSVDLGGRRIIKKKKKKKHNQKTKDKIQTTIA